MDISAPIIEIFSSLQGEGPRVGEKHLFVRFQDCELSCKFCDTPQSFVSNPHCRVEKAPFSKTFDLIPNPLTVEQLNQTLEGFNDKVIAITGGEPLQKLQFLKEWLPTVHTRFQILLETAGIHTEALSQLLPWIDIVSMDLKLPSSTGMRPLWTEHETFLRLSSDKELYVKVVVTSETSKEDLQKAMELVASMNPKIPFILQPATPFAKFRSSPSIHQVAAWQAMAQKVLPDVRVIPQMHKQMGIL